MTPTITATTTTTILSLALCTSQCLPHHRLLEHLQRQRGLIVRHLMPSPENSEEAQIRDALERASLDAVDVVGRQRFACKGGCAGVLDRVGGREAAKPIADPVSVASPHDNADTGLDDGGEGGKEVAGVWWGVSFWRFLEVFGLGGGGACRRRSQLYDFGVSTTHFRDMLEL